MSSSPPQKRPTAKRRRTGGREAATFGLVVWGVASWRLFVAIPPEHVESYTAAYGAMSTAVWLAVTAAFGWQRISGAVAARTDPQGAETWRE